MFKVAPPPIIRLSPSTYPSVAQLKLLNVPVKLIVSPLTLVKG